MRLIGLDLLGSWHSMLPAGLLASRIVPWDLGGMYLDEGRDPEQSIKSWHEAVFSIRKSQQQLFIASEGEACQGWLRGPIPYA